MHFPPLHGSAIKVHGARILHSHFGDMGWYDIPMAKKYGLRHIVTFYGYDVGLLPNLKPIWRERYLELFRSADLFLCEGPHMAECLFRLGCPREKVRVQRLGAELDGISFAPRKISEDGLVKILIAGTFREQKGIPDALKAIGIIKDRFPNIRVTVIGDATGSQRDQDEKRKILEVIKSYDLKPIIRLMGFQPFSVLMEEAYKSHIFLSPSVTASDGDTEGGSPVTITEMAASGMPVISTNHCDIPQAVKDGETGWLVAEHDPEALSRVLIYAIENNKTWPEVGRKARVHINAFFNARDLAKKLEEHYSGLLQKDGQ
ncbi:MAG: glycosyltransferase [Nitrospirota bacterium]